MMDQIVSTLNGAPQVEKRDPNKTNYDRGSRDQGGFGDALSSVKKPAHGALDDEKQPVANALDDDSAAPDQTTHDHGDEAAKLARQRKADMRAEAILNTKNIRAGQRDGLPNSDDANGRLSLRQSLKGKAVEDTAALKRLPSQADRLSTERGKGKADIDLNGDAGGHLSLADIVASLSVSADAAAQANVGAGSGALGGDGKDRHGPRGSAAISKFGADQTDTQSARAIDNIEDSGPDFESDSEAIYRFNASKSGSLRSMDMAVRSSEGRVDFEVKEGATRITENITVLDSRRFLGLATPSNASSIAGLIASDSDWMSAMRPESALLNAAAQSSTGKVVHTLKLQLTPIELGSVTMSLRMVGEELAVHMTVDNVAAYRRLQDDNRSMMEALKAHGITVDQITISVSASEKSDQMSGQSNGQGAGSGLQGNAEAEQRGQGARARNGASDGQGEGIAHANDVGSERDHPSNGVYI